MSTIEFAIELTVPDNAAFTVLTALRQLGYKDISRVERSELLRLTYESSTATPEERARALTHAEIVFNPNKHRLGYAREAELGDFEAVVEDVDDDCSGLRTALATHFGIDGLAKVERAVAWRLFEGGRPATADRLAWACRSLLANPVSQRYTTRRRPAYRFVAAEVRSARA